MNDIFVAFDTETTDFPWKGGRLIELAGVKFRLSSGLVIGNFQTFVDPGPDALMNPDAFEVHGIPLEDARQGAPFKDAFLQFHSFANGAPLVAHNASFETQVLKREFELADMPSPGGTIFCTMLMAKKHWSERSGKGAHTLGNLSELIGVDSSGWHRALADSMMCKELFLHMKREAVA
ncbi:MAG: 3'-5' exonuclease [Bdellovibrionales bacterium]|nr:3'-5' exonuclease [Bdellovibrionales bacterium]